MPESARHRPRFVFLAVPLGQSGLNRYGWRLAAANHRPIGRGVRTHLSLEECRADARALQAALGVPRPGLEVVEPIKGCWTWRALAHGVPAAVSVRPYSRRVECQRALDQFVTAARAADPAEGVARKYGPHAPNDFDRPAGCRIGGDHAVVPPGARPCRGRTFLLSSRASNGWQPEIGGDSHPVPGVPYPEPSGEESDWESRLFLWWAIRRVYAACQAEAETFPLVTAEGAAELRGITETLVSVTPLRRDAAVELLEPVVGRANVDQWKRYRVVWA